MKESSPMTDRLVEELDARLSEFALVVGMRIMASWAEGANLSLAEAHALLVLAMSRDGSSASHLADVTGIGVERLHPTLDRLAERGLVRESHRRYALTDAGTASVSTLEAARRAGIADYLAHVDPEDRRALAAALGIVT